MEITEHRERDMKKEGDALLVRLFITLFLIMCSFTEIL